MSETASTDRRGGGVPFSGARTVAATAIFAALAVALGYLLAPVPNVELVTLTVFAGGIALGRLRGALVGAAAMAIYSGFSPNGSGLAIPPLYAAQVLAMALAGLAGGVSVGFWTSAVDLPRWRVALAGGAAGLLLTALYQCLVIAGLAVAMPQFNQGLMAALAANAFFSVIHLVSNTVIFSVLGPTLLVRLGASPTGAPGPSGPGPTRTVRRP